MRVRFLTSICGAGWAVSHGDIRNSSDEQAARLIAAGLAELVPDQQSEETATAPDGVAERAATAPARSKRQASVAKAVAP